MSQTTAELLAELRSPHNDFPAYYTELCARAADAIERLRVPDEVRARMADMLEDERIRALKGLPLMPDEELQLRMDTLRYVHTAFYASTPANPLP